MPKTLRAIATTAALALAAAAATAQPPPPPPPPPSGDGGFNFRDHLDVELVGLFSSSSAITRQATKVAVRWQQDFGRSRLVAGLDFEGRTTELDTELKRQYVFDCDQTEPPDTTGDCERKRTLKLEDDPEARIDELYFNWVALDNLEVGVGISAVSWGQFLVISPVNFLLPQSLGADLGLDRGTLQQPQPHVSVRFSPLDRLEIEGYFFSELRIDPLIAAVEAAEFDNLTARQAANYLTDKQQAALRVVYRPDWGAWGVTLFDGVDHFTVHRPTQVSRFCEYLNANNANEALSTACSVVPENQTGVEINYSNCDALGRACEPPGSDSDPRRGELADATAFALEFAYNLGGGWSVLAELSRIETKTVPFSLVGLPRKFHVDAKYVNIEDPEGGYDSEGEPNPDQTLRPGDLEERLSRYSLQNKAGVFNERLDPSVRRACDFNEALISTHGGPGVPAEMRTCKDLVDPAYYRDSRQNGINRDDYTLTILSVGVEKLSTADVGWSYSLQLLAILQDYSNPFHSELVRLQELAGNEVPSDTAVFPGFYATYSHNVFNRPGNLVIGTGYFAGFAGITGLWNVNILDNVSFQLGLEAISRVSDDQRVDAEGREQRYELAGGGGVQPGINLGFSVSF